ncbi:MAG: pyridoxal-phosphate dependent enzyme, partial [Desulfobacterales bacterium]
MDIAKEVIAAEKRIRPYIRKTILEYSPYYSRLTEANVHFKLENLQYTGSFKLRGAMNKMLSLSPRQRDRGVVTASTGNHGAAVAYGLGKLG